MLVRVGLENGVEGRSLAWALDHPGCFAYGPDGQSAVFAMAQAVPAYIGWMESHTPHPWFNPAEIDIRLVEIWETYCIDDQYQRAKEGYEVNAWFQSDWLPLGDLEVERGLTLLAWTRQDLLGLIAPLDDGFLDRSPEEGAWPARRILKHIGMAEWWYLDRLGRAGVGREDLPAGPIERLHVTREILQENLPCLVDEYLVVGKDGEFWSPRKLLRRAVWHELDHLLQIQDLIKKFQGMDR